MSRYYRYVALRSRLRRRLRDAGVGDADRLATADPVVQAAAERFFAACAAVAEAPGDDVAFAEGDEAAGAMVAALLASSVMES